MKRQITERQIKRKVNQLRTAGRPLGVADFYRICRMEEITVDIRSSVKATFVFPMCGSWFIVIGKSLTGRTRLFAMFHELGHYFLDHKGDNLKSAFSGDNQSQAEDEADTFAEIATGISRNDAREVLRTGGRAS